MPLFRYLDDACFFCKNHVQKNDRQDMVIVPDDPEKGTACKRVCESCIPIMHKALRGTPEKAA